MGLLVRMSPKARRRRRSQITTTPERHCREQRQRAHVTPAWRGSRTNCNGRYDFTITRCKVRCRRRRPFWVAFCVLGAIWQRSSVGFPDLNPVPASEPRDERESCPAAWPRLKSDVRFSRSLTCYESKLLLVPVWAALLKRLEKQRGASCPKSFLSH